jgi:hypothetical protein
VSRGRLVVHAHFYQPVRADPFSGRIAHEPSAEPYDNWNARIAAECYRPNAERGNLARISYDLGPTLATWMREADPGTYRAFLAGDQPADDVATTTGGEAGGGNAMAQAFHHSILPLASLADRRTEIRWGLRDFFHRFGRQAEGLWLPETGVDLGTLRVLAEEGVRYTILAPWQADEAHLETRRPYRVQLGEGRSIVVAFYDAGLSAAVSFEPNATSDADRFARERVATRLAGSQYAFGEPGFVLIATDGELYGHHQQFRDLFLQRLVAPAPGLAERGIEVATLSAALLEPADRPFSPIRIQERTAWSCHHGVARWWAECPCATDGRWKGPLRAALERLAAGIDSVSESILAGLPNTPDLQAARDRYVDVVVGVEDPAAFAIRCLGERAGPEDRRILLALLEAQRWRLAMFASDGWYWDDPMRPETRQNLRAAAHAVRLVDGIAGTQLEQRLCGDLSLFSSPLHGLDGRAIYGEALAEVGQPLPAP